MTKNHKKKRLIIFIPSIEDGGVEKNLFIISNYLKKKNINVEILTCNNDKKNKFNHRIKIIGIASDPKSILLKASDIKLILLLIRLHVNSLLCHLNHHLYL